MIETLRSPLLVSKSKKGLFKYWNCFVTTDENGTWLTAEYWQQKKDGSESTKTVSTPKKIERKNVGKANETDEQQQAESELNSLVNKQLDKGYWIEGQEPAVLLLPMLAQDYSQHWSKLVGMEVIAQPKLDGVRCLFNNKRGAYSRKGKPFIEAVQRLFKLNIPDNITVDGELLLPDPYTFQQTVSAIKKERPETLLLQYVVYDLIDEHNVKAPYTDRYSALLELDEIDLIHSTVITIEDESSVDTFHDEMLSAGYEGVMLRNPDGVYEINNRSFHLLKCKRFVTEEFLIVGCEQEIVTVDGETQTAAVFVCSTVDGNQFNVRMKASHKDRVQMWTDREQYTNQWLTVQYQELTDGGVPRFPVGLTIRNYE